MRYSSIMLMTVVVLSLGASDAVVAQSTDRVNQKLNGTQSDVAGRCYISGDARIVFFDSENTAMGFGDTGLHHWFSSLGPSGPYTPHQLISSGVCDITGTNCFDEKLAPSSAYDIRFGALSFDGSIGVAVGRLTSNLRTNSLSDVYYFELNSSGSPTTNAGILISDRRVPCSTSDEFFSNDAGEPDISNDGDKVVFVSAQIGMLNDEEACADIFSPQIYVQDISTGNRVRITREDRNDPFSSVDGDTGRPCISGDGSFVAYDSASASIDEEQNIDGFHEIFVWNSSTNRTFAVSRNTANQLANGNCIDCDISYSGRYIVFQSLATNLVANYSVSAWHVYWIDRDVNGDGNFGGSSDSEVRLVTVSITGSTTVTGDITNPKRRMYPTVSDDGRFVAFVSARDDIVANDTNSSADIFYRDMIAGCTFRASVSTSGAESNNQSDRPSISKNGRAIAFESEASNLVSGDTNADWDVYVHTIRCIADFNGDGFVTGDDFDDFVAAFEIPDESADINCDGFVTGDDFDLFLVLFDAGC